MPRRIPPSVWLAVPILFALYFHGLDLAGLLGPDEPRYASIGRQMALSGDWITPRLWGAAWFEKPALLYWMTGAGFRLGLGTELAPRLPVALLSVAFLGLFFHLLRRDAGPRPAAFSTAILATSGGWLGYSFVAVPDLPMSAAFSAALLVALPWAVRGDTRHLPWSAALLGLAVLAKGLVPLVLVLPLAFTARRRLRDLLAPRVWGVFALVALPWYLACSWLYGRLFWEKFFLEHHFGRFSSSALLHQQPVWFYLPILGAGLLPWAPLLLTLGRPSFYSEPRRRLLLATVLFGFLFFSLSTNKLPGYLLPLLPAVAALAGISLSELKDARAWLAGCGLGSLALLMAAQMLPGALVNGLSRTPPARPSWTWLLALAVAAAAWRLESRGRRGTSVALLVVAVAVAVFYLKATALPLIDRTSSARSLWRSVAPRAASVCLESLPRAWHYGLNYYSVTPLPACAGRALPAAITQVPGQPPVLLAPRALTPPTPAR